MIRDTSSQDIPIARPRAKRRVGLVAAAVAIVALGAWALPQARQLLGTNASVSVERLGLDDVSRGPFVQIGRAHV